MPLNIFLETCPEMHALAKMAKIPPKLGKYSYEVAKESEDFHKNLSYKSNKMEKASPLKVTILPKIANLAKTMKMAKIHQSLRKN